MVATREERFKQKFETTYGEGQWERFVRMVQQTPRPRPSDVQQLFVSHKSGSAMAKSSYYMWEARAQAEG